MKPKFIIFPEINIKKPVITIPTETAVIFSESFGKAKPIHFTIAEIYKVSFVTTHKIHIAVSRASSLSKRPN